jgi:cyanate permease
MTQVAMALGPSVFGGIRQAWGSYAPALVLGAMLNLVAAAALVWGGRRPLVRS